MYMHPAPVLCNVCALRRHDLVLMGCIKASKTALSLHETLDPHRVDVELSTLLALYGLDR
jgi:hypothetical protein